MAAITEIKNLFTLLLNNLRGFERCMLANGHVYYNETQALYSKIVLFAKGSEKNSYSKGLLSSQNKQFLKSSTTTTNVFIEDLQKFINAGQNRRLYVVMGKVQENGEIFLYTVFVDKRQDFWQIVGLSGTGPVEFMQLLNESQLIQEMKLRTGCNNIIRLTRTHNASPLPQSSAFMTSKFLHDVLGGVPWNRASWELQLHYDFDN